jgi:23S rRNA pseudouridine1911/1915/1917 synthase
MQKKAKRRDGILIYHEDRDIIVVEKPEGLLTVATNYTEHSLHSIVKTWRRRVWPVQRLDRETSGVIVFALNEESRDYLKEQFAEHSIEREYQGIVCGELLDSGTWQSRLKEDKNYFVRSHPHGEVAITHYEPLGYSSKKRTLVKFLLETGKKNQIRVHASEAGFPLLGDTKYGNLSWKRLALHAHRLSFTHPVTKKRMAFTSPSPLGETK